MAVDIAADIAADIVADIAVDIVADAAVDGVVALADEAAQAVVDVGLPSSILAFITTRGIGWPPIQINFFPILVKI